MIALTSAAGMLAALRPAHRIVFSSYILPRGRVEAALEQAAARGAEVHVRLDGYLWGGTKRMARGNRETIARLRAAGADARLVHRADGDGPGMHLKAAVCDGVAFLDDRNWNARGDTVVRDDDRAHVAAIREAALQRDVAPVGALALTKADALAFEAAVLKRSPAPKRVDVESEALGSGVISAALRELAQAGVRCRVLVSERAFRAHGNTRQTAVSLAKAGVEIRTVRSSEKLAIAGTRAWIGSADATSMYYDADRIDSGLRVTDPRITRTLESHFNAHWRAGKPLGSG